jgi:dTDP-4-amino-4,6-dideoxygalactose transaminase
MKQKKVLAVHGGGKAVEKKFPWPIFDETDTRAVEEVIRSGQWGDPDCTGLVARIEREFADYCGTAFAVSSVNGSVAIRLALIASGVRPGDEVIITPYTFIATATVVLEANCVPVFVDIEPDTYNIDPVRIEEAITEKTRAIIPVHFGGQACDMDRIMDIARRHRLAVIEDACHGHGGEYKGRKLGSIGDAGCFSFQSSKNLTCGEGGMTISNDQKMRDTVDSLRNVGRIQGGQWYEHHNLGCNYRMTAIQAALLSSQLKRLEELARRREENGKYLASLLEKIDGIVPLTRGHGETRHSYHIFVFRYDASKFNNLPKAEFAKWLAAEGVPAFMGYPKPLYRQPLFLEKRFFCYAIPPHVDYTKVHCPVVERACSSEGVWIQQAALLGDRSDMENFAEAILKIQRHCLDR